MNHQKPLLLPLNQNSLLLFVTFKPNFMNISNNKVVSLTYELKHDNAQGETIEVTDKNSPLVFLYGAGMMLPKFEQNLENLKVNDNFEFTLQADDAYGEIIQEAVIDLPIDVFMVEGKIDPEMLKVDNIIPMQDNQGNPLEGKILEVAEESVKMDFNHPMAGRNLHFTGTIVDLRDATEEEVSHGHVHGAHGHQH